MLTDFVLIRNIFKFNDKHGPTIIITKSPALSICDALMNLAFSINILNTICLLHFHSISGGDFVTFQFVPTA